MERKFVEYEVRWPAKSPTENGEYFGKTPIFEQALNAANNIHGILYGITETGEKVIFL